MNKKQVLDLIKILRRSHNAEAYLMVLCDEFLEKEEESYELREQVIEDCTDVTDLLWDMIGQHFGYEWGDFGWDRFIQLRFDCFTSDLTDEEIYNKLSKVNVVQERYWMLGGNTEKYKESYEEISKGVNVKRNKGILIGVVEDICNKTKTKERYFITKLEHLLESYSKGNIQIEEIYNEFDWFLHKRIIH
jgi:hypothetical protein